VVYEFSILEPETTVGDHTIVYDHATVGHESCIGSNVVLQRRVGVTSLVTVEDNVYFGIASYALRSYSVIAAGTFVHPYVMVLRSTQPGETVSLVSRKTYSLTVVE
jgi:UDP-3-O-[3-hydroxymyristoyl] glucosamine N-acyltransferase